MAFYAAYLEEILHALIQSLRSGQLLNSKRKISKGVSATGKKPTRYCIPVVLSVFCILNEFSKEESLALSEVAERSGIAKSTVFRVLTNLLYLDSARFNRVSILRNQEIAALRLERSRTG